MLSVRSEIGLGPFRPGPGGLPPYLAGREPEQDLFRALLAHLDGGEAPPSEVILYGPRGNGKTALLAWVRKEGADFPGVDVLALTPSDFDTKSELAECLLPRHWWETVRPQEIAIRGFTWRPGGSEPAPQIRSVLAVRASRKPLVILLDEAHTLQPGIGRALLNAAQQVGREAPFLLVLAGTPNLSSHLGTLGASFWGRSRIIRLGRLDGRAAAEAIRKPLEAENIAVTDGALEHIVRESHGYPFFVQLWGDAVWAHAVAGSLERVVSEDARACQADFNERRDGYYSQRHDELEELRLLGPARAVAETFESRPALSGAELEAAIRRGFGGAAGDDEVDATAQQFRHLGYIWRPGTRRRWEPGIPSLMDYILREVPAP